MSEALPLLSHDLELRFAPLQKNCVLEFLKNIGTPFISKQSDSKLCQSKIMTKACNDTKKATRDDNSNFSSSPRQDVIFVVTTF